jgi:hypothetical protein
MLPTATGRSAGAHGAQSSRLTLQLKQPQGCRQATQIVWLRGLGGGAVGQQTGSNQYP